MQKHGTNISPMEWGDYAKELVWVRMVLANNFMERILFMSSVLKTYQMIVLTNYATLQ